MALIRWESSSLGDLRDAIDQLFDRMRHRHYEAEASLPTYWKPMADITETDDSYVISADLPGVCREDMKIQMADQILSVSGERKTEVKNEQSHLIERYHGHFSRSFALPLPVDSAKISANYQNGVLRVTLPKAKATKAKQIKLN